MHELLLAIKDKYRIFIFVAVPQGENSQQHKLAQVSMQTLIDQAIV
jgi:hypothetical protein